MSFLGAAIRLLFARVVEDHARSEELLGNILPVPIAERLKHDPDAIAHSIPEVTVLFADVVGFTRFTEEVSPVELVRILNEIFRDFDALAVGDAYMAAAGLPGSRTDHATAAVELALGMIEVVERVSRAHHRNLQIRVGLHSGPVVAGVIGTHRLQYDLWGDTVNVANRMESHGQPGRVHLSHAARCALAGTFSTEPRGDIEVKGKGRMTTYWVLEDHQRGEGAESPS